MKLKLKIKYLTKKDEVMSVSGVVNVKALQVQAKQRSKMDKRLMASVPVS